jgi:hypothetical protein
MEFFMAIFKQQPMGFYTLETLKGDAKRHGIKVLNPDINTSLDKCIIKNESLRWTLSVEQVKGSIKIGSRCQCRFCWCRRFPRFYQVPWANFMIRLHEHFCWGPIAQSLVRPFRVVEVQVRANSSSGFPAT